MATNTKIIVTTVGTSIFTNYEEDIGNLSPLKTLENRQCSEWGNYSSDINSTKTIISGWLQKKKEDAAAEIKSILKLKEKFNNIKVVLLATDTILSVLAAQLLEDFFATGKFGVNCEICKNKGNICACENVVKGLQVQNSVQFEKEGMINLVERLSQLIKNYGKDSVVFNITGGYKATIPYITLMGQIYRIPTYYIFEDTDDLIKIPQAPVDFDFSVIDENYFLFGEISKKKKNISEKEKDVIERLKNDKLVAEENGELSFTPLGLILYERFKELYESGKYHKRNLLSKMVELKLFKYLVYEYVYNKYSKVKDKSSYIVEHGKKVGDKDYDIDVYLESEKEIKAIEVKPAGSVSIFCDKVKGCTNERSDSIEYKFRKGGFKFLIDEHNKKRNPKKLYLDLFLYYTDNLYPKIKGMLIDLKSKLEEEGVIGKNGIEFRIFLLKLSSNYAYDEQWEITGNSILDLDENKINKY